jgi:outer membrane biosynthesis protein TonB
MTFFESKPGVSLIKIITEFKLENYDLPSAKIALPIPVVELPKKIVEKIDKVKSVSEEKEKPQNIEKEKFKKIVKEKTEKVTENQAKSEDDQ